jgi:hypothetical protein
MCLTFSQKVKFKFKPRRFYNSKRAQVLFGLIHQIFYKHQSCQTEVIEQLFHSFLSSQSALLSNDWQTFLYEDHIGIDSLLFFV